MTVDVLVLLFPLVLAIHNLDEYLRYEDFIRIYHPRLPAKLTTRTAVFWAATALTAFAALICIGAFISRSPTLMLIAKVSICALMLNAVSHCALSIKRRVLLPGTRSAGLLVLPYSVLALAVMRSHGGESAGDLLRYAALGAIAIPVAVACFLCIGYAIASIPTPTGSRLRRSASILRQPDRNRHSN